MPEEVRTAARAARMSGARRAGMVLVLTCASQFIVILDASIVNVALPSIRHDLGFSPTGLAWVVNGYLLTFAGLMLLGGRAADLLGHRRLLITGLALFSAASLLGGLAQGAEALVAARVVQGAGAALMAPTTLAVLNTAFPEARARARAFGAWSAAGGVGGMAGALAGGALTTGWSWRWIFLINVPIGAALILAAIVSLPAGRRRRETLDVAGAITATGGLAALVYGIMQSAEHGWASARTLGTAVAGLLLLAAFLVIEARFAARPMLPLRLFGVPGVAAADGALLLFGGIAIAMWYFTSLFMQNVLGYSALQAGLGQTPAAVAFLIVARLTAGLLPRTGTRPLLWAGCVCFVVGFGSLTYAHPGSGYLTGMLGPTLLVATGIGLVFPTLMAAATAGADDRDAGVTGGLATTASQVGGAIGLAVLAAAAGRQVGTAAAYDRVFLVAAGLGLAVAAIGSAPGRRSAGDRLRLGG